MRASLSWWVCQTSGPSRFPSVTGNRADHGRTGGPENGSGDSAPRDVRHHNGHLHARTRRRKAEGAGKIRVAAGAVSARYTVELDRYRNLRSKLPVFRQPTRIWTLVLSAMADYANYTAKGIER